MALLSTTVFAGKCRQYNNKRCVSCSECIAVMYVVIIIGLGGNEFHISI